MNTFKSIKMAISQELENKQQMSGPGQDNLQILNSANSQDSVSVGKKKNTFVFNVIMKRHEWQWIREMNVRADKSFFLHHLK